jgi:hypothetical protein
VEADRAHLVTDGAALFLGSLNEGWAFADGEEFLTVGTVGLGGNSIPVALGSATAAAWDV